jgi:plasmid stabilization system protein ParE
VTPGRTSKNPDRLEIVWSPLATARLREICAYVALDKPRVAERLAMRIVILVESLRLQSRLGHSSGQPGMRELTIGGTPYVIFYRLRRNRILISMILHTAQQRPSR